jgi:hypothetical protein
MMKFKLKALVATLAMTAGSAFAAIPDGTTGNGGLFLEVYDGVGATYIRDLGITMNDFGTTQRATAGFTNNVNNGAFPVTGNGAIVNGQLSFASDANMTSFLTGTTAANVKWEVFAVDFAGTGAADGLRVLYTSSTNQQTAAAGAGIWMSDTQISTAIGNINNQLTSGATSINSLLGSNQSMITTTNTDIAFATFLGATMGGGTGSNVNTFTTLGSDAFMNYATRFSTSNTVEGIFVTYAGTNPFPVQLASNGTLTFAAPVPEPGTWAMLLAGLMMVGGIARRRLG